jgi:hypothetical protein
MSKLFFAFAFAVCAFANTISAKAQNYPAPKEGRLGCARLPLPHRRSPPRTPHPLHDHRRALGRACADTDTRRMVATRLSNSIGLASNSSHPWQWPLAFALQRIRGHADDRDVVGMRIVLEAPHGFPAVNAWHDEAILKQVKGPASDSRPTSSVVRTISE